MHTDTVSVPTYFMRHPLELGLTFVDMGVAVTLASFSNIDMTFNDFVVEAATQGPDDERLSNFQIRQIVQKLEDEQFLQVIKYKDSYSINWLPKALGNKK
jgi:hypothetical protein